MPGSNPLITTIIPTYRRPRLLQRAIQSVLRQTYRNFQVYVYDNASCDETASVVAELAKTDDRIHYFCHAKNIGMINNYNYTLEHVQTPFFSFLSDDDIYLPEFFQTAMQGFEQFPDALFSSGATVSMTDTGRIQGVYMHSWKREGYYASPEGLFEMIDKSGGPGFTATVFRREVIERVGSFDREVGAGVDTDYLLRIMARFPFVVSKRPCAIWVNHPLSSGASTDLHSIWPGGRKMICNLTEDERIPSVVRRRAGKVLTEQLKRRLFKYGLHCIIQKNYEDAYKVAKVLCDQFHATTTSRTLQGIAKLSQHCPPAFYMIMGLNTIRKRFQKREPWIGRADLSAATYLPYLQSNHCPGSGGDMSCVTRRT